LKELCENADNMAVVIVLCMFDCLWSISLCSLSLVIEQVVNKTRAALLYLRDLFPLRKFDSQIPPIVLQHQLYSIVTNRDLVNLQLVRNNLWLLIITVTVSNIIIVII